jgi:starch phosphorylase
VYNIVKDTGGHMNYKEFYVGINFPDTLKKLESLAYNLWWTYNNPAKDLFKMINPDLWENSMHNPIEVLSSIDKNKMDELASDQVFLSRLDYVWNLYIDYIQTPKWFELKKDIPFKDSMLVAYFSMEYGLHESIQTYAGGLGILSGDHCKSASDIGLPFVAVGLLYRNGYFHQYLNSDGWQLENYPNNDFSLMPITESTDDKGEKNYIEINSPEGVIKAKIWHIHLGMVKFVLLDTDIPENSESNRKITGKLYDGDPNMRIKQEILLGIGGVKALKKLGIAPTVFHLNEGHPAFSICERVNDLMLEKGLNFEEAFEFVKKTTLFTTHTPVPAGFDVFSEGEIVRNLGSVYFNAPLKIDDILKMGRFEPYNRSEPFSLAVFSAKGSVFRNGVSKLHGKVSKGIFHNLWKNIPEEFVPIDYITNGVHLPTWVSDECKRLYNRYLGEEWYLKPHKFEVWENVDDIPELELFETKNILRSRLIEYVRRKLKSEVRKKGGSHSEVLSAQEALRSDVLTIGFARRFATYKRGYLLFMESERLAKILNDPKRPVQIIIAGKAHPKDNGGKEIIKQIKHITRQQEFKNKVIFLEDYDIQMAKYLVRGVDVWLNNPRRPMEASGTSGMKVAANGGINFSIMDGWWDEGYDGHNGWSIGFGENYSDTKYQDYVESEELYDKLENEIIPMFYDRDKTAIPREWLKVMKNSIKSVASFFNTTRMVIEYSEKFYEELHKMYFELSEDDFAPLKDFVQWRKKVEGVWQYIKVGESDFEYKELKVGEKIKAVVKVDINNLVQSDMEVVCIIKRECDRDETFRFVPLEFVKMENNFSVYESEVTLECPGRFKAAFCIFPRHKFIKNRFENNLFIWS